MLENLVPEAKRAVKNRQTFRIETPFIRLRFGSRGECVAMQTALRTEARKNDIQSRSQAIDVSQSLAPHSNVLSASIADPIGTMLPMCVRMATRKMAFAGLTYREDLVAGSRHNGKLDSVQKPHEVTWMPLTYLHHTKPNERQESMHAEAWWVSISSPDSPSFPANDRLSLPHALVLLLP